MNRIYTLADARDEKRRNDYSDAELKQLHEDLVLRENPTIGVLVRNGERVFYLNGRHFESRNIDVVNRERIARGCLCSQVRRIDSSVPASQATKSGLLENA